MKKYVLIYITVVAIVLIGFVLFTSAGVHTPTYVDTVAVNEMLQRVTQNWPYIDMLETEGFPYRFFILDNEGQRIYSTAQGLPTSAISAIRIGFLPMSVTVNEQVVGTVLFETWTHSIQRINTAIVYALLLLCLINAVFMAVLYMAIVRPFRRIQRFAHKISLGILDESLTISKDNIFGLFTQSFDIMRESLQDARKKQYKAERANKELIASLSHDIKTPVTSIRLITELLQVSLASSMRNSPDASIPDKLKTIEAKTSQIDRLINDMLHSTLEELGELTVTPASTDSGVLLRLFENADHLSKIRTSPMPPCLLEMDAVRMEQVVGNIITNSYKYAGTNIDISFCLHDEGLQVDISDYGTGVESEEIELITTKFYRGTHAKALRKEGEGLGLYVSKQLMDKMGGGIEAFNRDDGFTVRLWVRLSQ